VAAFRREGMTMEVIIPRRNRRLAGSYTQFADVSTFKAQLATLPTGSISNITAFLPSSTAPAAGATIVNVAAQGYPEILCWAVGTSVYWYSAQNRVYLPESAAYMFSWTEGAINSKLESVDLSGISDFRTLSMSCMFLDCRALTTVNLTSFSTLKVKNMSYMFCRCTNLANIIGLSSFNTSNATDMNSMFYNCPKLTSLDLSSFNTSNVTNMYAMFSNCRGLTSLDVSMLDTSKVTNTSYMFSNCSGLTSLDLSSFDTSKVTNTSSMFGHCSNLTSLDLSMFDTTSVTNMSYMFEESTALRSIYVSIHLIQPWLQVARACLINAAASSAAPGQPTTAAIKIRNMPASTTHPTRRAISR